MRKFQLLLLVVLLSCVPVCFAQESAPLRLIQTITMPKVEGRLDHMGVDVKGKRLFVAALGNNSLEVIDLIYTEHKIPFEVFSWPFKDGGFVEVGTLFTIGGCSPLGCGTDDASIDVRVKVDADGTVVGEPDVVSMYTNCL